MTGRNQTSNPQPKGVRDCNLCSLRKALLAVARKNGLAGCITCLEKGNACLRSISFGDAAQNLSMFSRTTWNMCSAGKILCTSVDRSKNYALFGGHQKIVAGTNNYQDSLYDTSAQRRPVISVRLLRDSN
ncbi:hypothetical protein C4D60_Mb06t12990 [Musa balbisiana]|uniref:Uncharacterized protein n=1 Tax=Musa balbisiana TaxID=52838 RepID=A0A4V4H3W0_MUSBA|nr:hypothetical protein C4D60_Mb06t12990 [Musa balbisiana]